MESNPRHKPISLSQELKLLEDLEAVENPLSPRIFMGIGTDPEFFDTSKEYETMRSLFPKPKMRQDEIMEIVNREKLGKVLFIAMVDGSKLPGEGPQYTKNTMQII